MGDQLWGRSPDHRYLPDEALIAATNVAIALGLPLLLTGEAGCGKTDFAFAIARFQSGKGRAWDPDDADDGLLDCYVRSDSRARDLLYHYDAVRRFGDAHHGQQVRAADPRYYIELRNLGRALAEAEVRGRQRVVLIDEIDKAPRDLPNDLLRELDQGRFEIKS
ncbi:MAG: AAA family ATPase [bacterium]